MIDNKSANIDYGTTTNYKVAMTVRSCKERQMTTMGYNDFSTYQGHGDGLVFCHCCLILLVWRVATTHRIAASITRGSCTRSDCAEEANRTPQKSKRLSQSPT
jgi:hypothetical protein